MNKKICVICEICVTQTSHKDLCISVKSVGLFPTSGGICTDRTGRLRENPCVIASSGKPPNKFRVIR